MPFTRCLLRPPDGRRRLPGWTPPLAVGALAVLLAGCAGTPASEAEWDQRTTRLLKARKASSQAGVNRDRIAGLPADQFVNTRTALLLGGNGTVTTKLSPNGRTAIVGWEMRPGQGAGSVSSAAAVSPDGYFLTAAHAVSEPRMQLVRTTDRGLAVARVRPVWKGDPSRGGPDLALIHVPAHQQAYFLLRDEAPGPARRRVWTGGFGDVRQNQTSGWLRSFGPWRRDGDGPRWRVVEHTAPLMRGDSGGPLVDGDGRLLGVNTEFLVQPASLLGVDHLRVYRPMAMAPAPEWLEELMARDRAAQAGKKKSGRRPRS